MNSAGTGSDLTAETAEEDKKRMQTGQGTGQPSVPHKSIRKRTGHLIVVTGPSGVGKGTVVSRLMQQVPDLKKSVSVTTRGIRSGEVEGVDYFFRSIDTFLEMIEQGLFLENAQFAGYLYGTPRQWVMEQLEKKIDVILEIEVQGAKQIMERFPAAILIFLSPPSMDELQNRLKNRATETHVEQLLRYHKARQEMGERYLFHYEVVNDNIEEAVNNLAHIVYAERCRIREMGPVNEHDKNS